MNNRETFMSRTVVVCLGALLCCALWGSAFTCIKLGYEWLNIQSSETSVQILYAGMRFTLAGVLTILFGSILSRKLLKPKRTTIGKVVTLSMLQTVAQYLFFYIGLAHTSGVKASIIEGANVFLAILVASLIFHQEKLSTRKMAGSVIGFIGVVLINLNGTGLDASVSFLGEGFILLSTLAYAVSSVVIKRYSKDENPVTLSGYQFTLGGLIMIVAGLLLSGRIPEWNLPAVLMLVYLAMVSAVRSEEHTSNSSHL